MPHLTCHASAPGHDSRENAVDLRHYRRVGNPAGVERLHPGLRQQVVDPQHVEEQVEPGLRIEDPAPDDAGHHERERVGKEEDVAKDVMARKLAVEQDGQCQPQRHGKGDEENREDKGVAQIGLPAHHVEHLAIGGEDRFAQRQVRLQRAPVGERDPEGDADEDVDEDRQRQDRRQQQEDCLCLLREMPAPVAAGMTDAESVEAVVMGMPF